MNSIQAKTRTNT